MPNTLLSAAFFFFAATFHALPIVFTVCMVGGFVNLAFGLLDLSAEAKQEASYESNMTTTRTIRTKCD